MSNSLLDKLFKEPDEPDVHISGAERRKEALYRLQIGFAGLLGIVLLIAVSDAIISRTTQSAAEDAPQATAITEPQNDEQPQVDPLAEAGLVPDLPTLEEGEKAAVAGKTEATTKKTTPEIR